MADVLTKINHDQEFSNGAAITSANMLGGYKKVAATVERNILIAQSGALDPRFDDIRYYTNNT